MDVVVNRGGRERQISVAVGDLPTASAERVSALGDLDLITVTAAVRQERRIQSEQGALIYDIGNRTQSATGLRSGDVIIQINRTRIARAEDVRDLFRRLSGRSAIRIFVERSGSLVIRDFYVQ